MRRILILVLTLIFSPFVLAQSIRIGWPANPQASDDVFVLRYFTVASGQGYGTMPRAYAVEARRVLGPKAEVGLAGWAGGASGALSAPDGTRLMSSEVTFNALSLLRAKPVLGRDFTEADARAGRRLVILTTNTWRSHFGSRVDAIGAVLPLGGLEKPSTAEVIGVLGPGVFAATPELDPDADVFVLSREILDASPAGVERAVAPIVRLPAGFTAAQAQTALGEAATRLQATGIGEAGHSLRLESLRHPRR
jgi:hypothetical protein